MSPELLFPLLGLLLVALGLPLALRKVRPNRWYGLRVPATFADLAVWYQANAVTGKDMVILGTALTAVALVLPHVVRLQSPIYAGICAAVVGVGSLLLAARGWRLANRLLRQQGNAAAKRSIGGP